MFGKPQKPGLPGLRAQDDADVTVKAVPWAGSTSRRHWLTCVRESRRYSRQFRCLLRQCLQFHEAFHQSLAKDELKKDTNQMSIVARLERHVRSRLLSLRE